MAAASNNRRTVILLAIGGLLIAAFALYSLTSGGGGSDNAADGKISPNSGGPGTGALTPSAPSTPTTTAPASPSLPSGQFDVFATRNPFEPAIEVTDSGTGAPQTGPDETVPGGGVPVDPSTPTDTTPTTPASPDPAAGTTVAVIDVFDQAGVTSAVVQVGSTQYTVAAGQVFATSYKVVSLSGTCGQFMYGDSPFSLCEGEQVIK
jgi:hypothetical protein